MRAQTTVGPLARTEELSARAVALWREGKLCAAAEAFDTLAELRPRDWLAQYNAGAVCIAAEQPQRAAKRLERAAALNSTLETWRLLAHAQALLGDMQAAKDAYETAVRHAPRDFAAHWGLFEVLQLLDDNTAALEHQRIALQERSILTIEARVQPARTTILVLCIAGTFQANVPLDFILDRDHTTVHKVFVGEYPLPPLPPYDLVFNAIAEASNAGPALAAADALIAGQDRPAINAPRDVMLTSRDSVAALFAGCASVAVAPTVRAARAAAASAHPPFPFLIRPLDSHAGNDLAKIDDAAALAAYLCAAEPDGELYLTAFVDYRNSDGYYRKYRIVFVDGVPYPVHLAISPRWMIHYYNAPMAENAWMRDEEHAFMRDLDSVFDGLRADGLREIARRIPLDYFGIDCSIAPDGRVLLFEASSAMIVHLRDPVDLYPYKAQYVPRVIHALERLFDDRLKRTSGAHA